ncbi:SDR family oxidoreductase [Actinokineospora sp. NBRC 105648]|uniref:SDR family NAD(P)-dependent oxidoreductase n=1 Tax=Actinokineospora sp. NBRC 105648 TaxID=3032206 RepID=UPI0024A5EBA3|nr:SDR family oxidoreductase [Actinokineospora sp. NBRC 105648]GLZ41341.1 3-oxoacyl-ACP reductase [Actinokineospora sp. NBRC 105648]
MRFADTVTLITGAGTGIGAATARRLVAEGGRVVLTGRREAPLREVAESLGELALVLPGDAADSTAVRGIVAALLERFGRLDNVVANAGGHGLGTATDTDDAGWQKAIEVNLTSAFVTIRESLPALSVRGGSVVLVSSLAGLFSGPAVAGYVTTKHGLIGLTRSIARDYGKHGVRANAVCPGWVRTPMADEQMDELGSGKGIDRAAAYELVTENTPLGRPAEPEEIASVIAFLASSDAAIVSGAVVTADAGASAVDLPTIAFD